MWDSRDFIQYPKLIIFGRVQHYTADGLVEAFEKTWSFP